jgi:hypothetical protein
MRDAFGGAFMIKLFLVFIAIYIGFTAVALNYAKAFKVKNKIIEYLESSEISNLDNMDATQMLAMQDFIDKEILGNMNYNVNHLNICSSVKKTDDAGNTIAVCHNSGIVIEEVTKATNTEGVYYRVSTYVGWSIPFLNGLLSLNGNNAKRDVPVGVWKISGETRLIVNE